MRLKYLLLICFSVTFQRSNAQSLYVDASKTSSGAGTTWGTAYKTLSEALNTAWQDATITTVYVAKGSYAPTNYPYTMGANKLGTAVTSAITGYTLTNFDKTFHIRTGLEVYGGYPPGGGTRNLVGNETILNPNSSSYHVVLIDSAANWATANDTTILDGFTVTGGFANNALTYTLNGSAIYSYTGGGIDVITGSVKLQNNNITANTCNTGAATAMGGGVYNSASTIFTKNNINGNSCLANISSAYGAGVYSNKAASFFNNIVSSNIATSPNSSIGGGITVQLIQPLNQPTIITGNIIVGNTTNSNASSSGAGLYLYLYGTGAAVITNNVIANNSCSAGLGGGVYTSYGTFTFNNDVFSNNLLAGGLGAALTSTGSRNQGIYNTINFINNCIFWGNSGTTLPDVSNQQTIMNVYNTILQLPAASYTTSFNLLGLASPDKNLYATDPLFVNANNIAGPDGIYGTTDDGLALTKNSPAINAGSNMLVPTNIVTDIANNARIQFSTVDMGAYESPYGTILPLTLLNFSGNRQGNDNLLQWATTNEVGTKTFVVESSANGNNFATIGNVPAIGGGKYLFTDNNAIANRTYYRLKMVDTDGKFTYSNIIWISTNVTNNISVYPNPVGLTTTLNINNNSQLIGTKAQLTDVGGRLLQQITISRNQEQLNMSALPAGLYLLKLNDGTAVKIMKQ